MWYISIQCKVILGTTVVIGVQGTLRQGGLVFALQGGGGNFEGSGGGGWPKVKPKFSPLSKSDD